VEVVTVGYGPVLMLSGRTKETHERFQKISFERNILLNICFYKYFHVPVLDPGG
jgi:hypothetical protein